MKLIKYSALATMLVGTIAANAAETGTLQISGTVVEHTCSVPADQLTQTVDMGTITPAGLKALNEGEGLTKADKSLHFDVTDCPAATTAVGIKFDFTPDAAGAQYMANTGSATGVALGIVDADDAQVINGGVAHAKDLDAAAGTATVNAKVRVYRVGSAEPVAGDIASTTTVTVTTN